MEKPESLQRSAVAPNTSTALKRCSRANDSPKAAPVSAARSPAAPHSAASTQAAAPVATASMANRRLSEFGLTSPGAMAALLRQPTVDQPTQTTYRGATGELLSPASNKVHSLQLLSDPAKSLKIGAEGQGSQIHSPPQEPTLARTLDERLEVLDDNAKDPHETTKYLGDGTLLARRILRNSLAGLPNSGTLDRDGLLAKALAKARWRSSKSSRNIQTPQH